jgi:hypothetical protein
MISLHIYNIFQLYIYFFPPDKFLKSIHVNVHRIDCLLFSLSPEEATKHFLCSET